MIAILLRFLLTYTRIVLVLVASGSMEIRHVHIKIDGNEVSSRGKYSLYYIQLL